MVRPIRNVLFVCSRNSSQSIIAESVLNGLGGGRFRGHSAGLDPSGRVHPQALLTLAAAGCPLAGLRSKPLAEFLRQGAPSMDLVITLGGAGAAPPPTLPRSLVLAHWEVCDPERRTDPGDDERAAFHALLVTLRRRVQHVTALHFDSVDARALGPQLREIGALP